MSEAVAELRDFHRAQCAAWPLLRRGVDSLSQVLTKEISVAGNVVTVQFNPTRTENVTANVVNAVDAGSCFLCESKRPAEQQAIPFGDDFLILCNPRPIFPEHFTVAHRSHRPQSITEYVKEFLDLARAYPGFAVFFNGAKSGASAPFHAHFQMVPSAALPLCAKDSTVDSRFTGQPVHLLAEAELYAEIAALPAAMLNIIAWREGEGLRIALFRRSVHRPKSFFDQTFIVSPACVELGGVWVTIRESDFRKADADTISGILREVVAA